MTSTYEQVVAMVRAGHSQHYVATALGIGRDTVRRHCRAAGVEPAWSYRKKPHLRLEGQAMHLAGIGFREAARRLGVSDAAVRLWCDKRLTADERARAAELAEQYR